MKTCLEKVSARRLCLIAQRAMKQMTGYFGGYISKKQKVGKFELKKSISTLPLLQQKVEGRGVKSASTQLAHVVNRMFTTLEGKGILRVATEEFLLSSRYKPHDPLAAEFIRTFRSRNFPGMFFIERYDALSQGRENIDVRTLLPKNALRHGVVDVVSLYGFRAPDVPDLWYLSPWEFVQWVKPERTRAPSAEYKLTMWTANGKKKLAEAKGQKVIFEPGRDYVLDEPVIRKTAGVYSFHSGSILFPKTTSETYDSFQQAWVLRLRQRPVVPAPECCPMPTRRKSKEAQSKIYSVYLRPWTLIRRCATLEVPFLGDIQIVPSGSAQQETTPNTEASVHDMRRAWKLYIQQIPPHAFRQVRNFMLASIAEGRVFEEEEDKLRRGDTLRCDLSTADLEEALRFRMPEKPAENIKDDTADGITQSAMRVWRCTDLAVRLANLTEIGRNVCIESRENITQLCWTKPVKPTKSTEAVDPYEKASCADLNTESWTTRYKTWYQEVFINTRTKTPNELQALVLHTIHDRRFVVVRRYTI